MLRLLRKRRPFINPHDINYDYKTDNERYTVVEPEAQCDTRRCLEIDLGDFYSQQWDNKMREKNLVTENQYSKIC